ncbi:MAG: general secretion pathway protein GspB [Pseudomonadota bacterium]
MSLILDALRRAETQRHTQSQPVYSLPSGRRTRSDAVPLPQGALIGAAAGAVIIAAVAVTWTAMRTGEGGDPNAPTFAQTTPAPQTAEEVVAQPDRQRRTSTPRASRDTPREMSSLTALARADDLVVANPSTSTVPTVSAGSVQVVEARSPDAATPSSPTPGSVTPGTVVVRDLLAEEGITAGGGSITVATPAAPSPVTAQVAPAAPPPEPTRVSPSVANLASAPTQFTLNMLSTSPDPANSYVYINMRRYAIGDQTSEGAIVDDISNAGAVIRYRGQRYLLKSR